MALIVNLNEVSKPIYTQYDNALRRLGLFDHIVILGMGSTFIPNHQRAFLGQFLAVGPTFSSPSIEDVYAHNYEKLCRCAVGRARPNGLRRVYGRNSSRIYITSVCHTNVKYGCWPTEETEYMIHDLSQNYQKISNLLRLKNNPI